MKTYFQASNNRNPTLEHSSSNIKNLEYSRTHQLQLDQAPLLAGGAAPVLAAALRGEQLLQGGQPAPGAPGVVDEGELDQGEEDEGGAGPHPDVYRLTIIKLLNVHIFIGPTLVS